ncbi:hypothetical protein BDN72DRAFT_853736 [Pluteus cervinus]|uniref:Uncharacterized protein n=1 Tax=Pluteus cervinus TaxID=181527 RepID=A0ACD3BBU8_9AGAR|nr:hypothetical protein BDN72DRAFT_853736 [Pluteus cervinus]
MTTIPPTVSAQQPSPPNDPSSSTQLSWEGDKMFNIYIYDYCYKRGFRKTARELLQEAEIPPESTPPINAKQGLLFEWWSVFWVLFTAKASGTGSDDAMLYTQHQQTQVANRQRLQQQQGVPPMNQLPTTPMQQSQTQPQPVMGRMINGMPRAQNYLPNGAMANGVGNTAMQQGAMAPGAHSGFPMGGPSPPQPNGIAGHPPPPNTQGAPHPSHSLFQNAQRPLSGPQRGVNGVPFQSPTMAHSPQNSGPGPGQQSMQQQQQQQQQHQQPQPPQAPMSQLGPTTPGLQPPNRGMLPPQGGPPGMNQMMVSGGQHPGGTPTQTFQQVGRPPSRTATPGQTGGMMQPSPSMVHRQAPGSGGMMSQEQAVNMELQHMPQAVLAALKAEIGCGSKDINTLTQAEKNRIVATYRQRGMRKPGENNAGPSQMTPIQNQQRNPQQPQQPSQQQQQRAKRSSTSPGEEHEMLPQSDSSPPAAKRMRTSPAMEPSVPNQGMPPMGFGHPGQAPTPVGSLPGQPPQGPPQMGMGPNPVQSQAPGHGQNLAMMRGPAPGTPNSHMGPMNGAGPHQQGPPGMPMNIGMQMMNSGMSHATPGPMMGLQQMQAREALYRQSLHSIHKSSMPQPGGMNPLANGGSPAADPGFNNPGAGPGSQFNQGMAQNRMMMNKPMMPPPSQMGGPSKDAGAQGGKDGKNDGSPRNGPPIPGQPMHGGGPTTPGPQGQSSQQAMSAMAPSPSSILTTPAQPQPQPPQPGPPVQSSMIPQSQPPQNSAPQAPPPPASPSVADMSNIFSNDFISNIASSLEVFDSTNLFRPDGDINFERDFGQWFNPEDVNGNLDMK